MTGERLVYRVDDRSILLPYYQRLFVKPLLPLIPASLSPNAITHAGHAMNLAAAALLIAVWPRGGWAYAVSALLLQLYLWCDNADGAHARRTNQCSPFGEFLDHGLDQLNTVYIGYLTAMAIGAPPIGWVVITLIIPGAAVVTYWEQAATGVFRVGLLNQVESLLVLSAALLASAVFGVDVFTQTRLFGISLQTAALGWCAVTIVFGMLRSIQRVAQENGLQAVAPIVPLLATGVTVLGAAWVDALTTVEAVAIATGQTIYFGMAMLTYRLTMRRPRFEFQLVLGAFVGAGIIGWRLLGQPVGTMTGPVLVTLSCVSYGAMTLLAVKSNVNHIERGPELTAR